MRQSNSKIIHTTVVATLTALVTLVAVPVAIGLVAFVIGGLVAAIVG